MSSRINLGDVHAGIDLEALRRDGEAKQARLARMNEKREKARKRKLRRNQRKAHK